MWQVDLMLLLAVFLRDRNQPSVDTAKSVSVTVVLLHLFKASPDTEILQQTSMFSQLIRQSLVGDC
jgi:hypothetical protein